MMSETLGCIGPPDNPSAARSPGAVVTFNGQSRPDLLPRRPALSLSGALLSYQPKEAPMGNEDAIPSMTDPITGRAMGLFTAQYEHDGATWGLDFWAYDQDDANAKLAAIRAGATMDGLVQHIIPGALSQIRKGARVRFKQGDPTIIPLVPGPSEAFTVLGIVDEHWANLGPAHPMVALTILEPA